MCMHESGLRHTASSSRGQPEGPRWDLLRVGLAVGLSAGWGSTAGPPTGWSRHRTPIRVGLAVGLRSSLTFLRWQCRERGRGDLGGSSQGWVQKGVHGGTSYGLGSPPDPHQGWARRWSPVLSHPSPTAVQRERTRGPRRALPGERQCETSS